jgi:predicted 2-oxoglutarate/Fe(II)-dependent dioxygenase YbiX
MDTQIRDLVEAAKAGNPRALTELAHAQALGFCTPRNVDIALDNLARAAAVGWAPALQELQFLARAAGSNAKTLRSSINPEKWRKPPARRALLDAPRLRVFENFASAEECGWLIGRCRDQLQRAKIYNNSTDLQVGEARTNTEADYGFDFSDVALSLVRDRIARAVGVPVEHFEVAKLLHYNPGEAFARHSDFFHAWMTEEIEARGQRVATFLIYLNDEYEGGETEFVEVGYKFKGRKGDALLFINVDRDGAADPMSLHAGQPTTRGEKWVLSQWIRSKPINAYQTPRAPTAHLPPEWYRDA